MKRFIFIIIVLLLVGIPMIISMFSRMSPSVSFAATTTRTIVFIPGLELAPEDYTTILNNFTQKGYTIIEYRPTYTDTNDYTNMVNVWTQEVKELVGDKKVIVVGHSVGGAVAVHFCATDQRCKAGVNMDGSPAQYEKLPVSFLYLQAGTGQYCDQECLDGRTLMEQIANDSESTIVKLQDMKHFNFTDSALEPSTTLLEQDYLGEIDGEEGLDIINKELTSFLATLK